MKLRYFCPSIDSYATTNLTLEKANKEIVKLIHIEQFSPFYFET